MKPCERILRSPLALAMAAVVMGCVEPQADSNLADPAAAFTARDSGDIEIVENHAPEHPLGQFWTIDAEPEVVLGGDEWEAANPSQAGDSAQLIWQVSGLARLQDGRVAVLSSGNQRLFLFEPSGELSATIGRKGEGPGEFIRPGHLQYLPPDTLVVWDYWFAPTSYFDSNGTLLKERSIDLGEMMARVPGSNAESRATPLADGSFVLTTSPAPNSDPEPGSYFRFPTELVLVDTTYAPHPLGSWDGWEMWVSRTNIERGVFPTFLFDSYVATGGNPPSIYISSGDKDEIHQFSGDGTLLRIVRRTTGRLPFNERGHELWLAAFEARIRELFGDLEAELGMSWGELTDGMPIREWYPAAAGLLVDAEGFLWVREWSASGRGMPDQWSVFSPNGRWLGIVRGLPDLFLCHPLMGPCWVDRDFLLAVRRDALGVERVEGYRIHRGEGAAGSETPGSGTAEVERSVGELFRDCDVCPDMVVVPAGSFAMGSPDPEEGEVVEPEAMRDRPQHTVTIAAAFAVGIHEVTFDEWDACVRAGGCGGHTPDDGGWGRGRRPVINVSWEDAQAYAQWLTERTGHQYRLPSEAEWEFVARAGTRTARYWGESPDGQCDHANGYDVTLHDVDPSPYNAPANCSDGYEWTAPVGSFAPNPFGLYDMLGNVQEWVEDCRRFGYAGAPTDGSVWHKNACRDGHGVRGGSYGHPPPLLRSAQRLASPTARRSLYTGFRVARDLP